MKHLLILLLLTANIPFLFSQENGTFSREFFELSHLGEVHNFASLLNKYQNDPVKTILIRREISLLKENHTNDIISFDPSISLEEDLVERIQRSQIHLNNLEYSQAQEVLNNIKMSDDERSIFQQAEILRIRGCIYSRWNSFYLGLEHLTSAHEKFVSANSISGQIAADYNLVNLYLLFHRFDLFEQHLKGKWQKNHAYIEKHPHVRNRYNSFHAANFSIQGKPDSALLMLRRNLNSFITLGDSANSMKTYLNISFIHAKGNKPDSSLLYLKQAKEYNLELPDKRKHIRMLISLMDLLANKDYQQEVLSLFNYPDMSAYFNDLDQILTSVNNQDLTLHFLWKKTHYHEDRGEIDLSYETMRRESDFLIERQISDTASLQLIRFQLGKQKAENEVLMLVSERQKQQKLIYLISFIVIILLFILFGFYFYKSKKNRFEQQIKALEILRVQEKLSQTEASLNEFKRLTIEKSKLIETIEKNIEIDDENRAKLTSDLHRMKILTNADWNRFQELFSQVYPKMEPLLVEKNIHLSESEKRILMLQKMAFNKEQISSAIGIGSESVRKSIYRLKKKLAPIELDLLLAQF